MELIHRVVDIVGAVVLVLGAVAVAVAGTRAALTFISRGGKGWDL